MLEHDDWAHNEFSVIENELQCDKTELKKMIKNTRIQYPHISKDKDALYIVAKENNLQFDYDTNGELTGVKQADPDLDVDLMEFLE